MQCLGLNFEYGTINSSIYLLGYKVIEEVTVRPSNLQVHHSRLSELEARKYFQQLIEGVEFCHSRGVYHRDLKVIAHYPSS